MNDDEPRATPIDPKGIHAACFSPDCGMLITAHVDGALAEWDARTGERLRLFLDGGEIEDGKIIGEKGEDLGIRLVRLSKPIGRSSLTSVCFSRDGQWFAVGAANGWIVIWTTFGGGECSAWQAHDRAVVALDFSPDLSFLATGCDENAEMTLKVWRIQLGQMPAVSGEEVLADDTHGGGVSSVCFSPDSRHLLAGGFGLSSYTAPQIYDLETKERVAALYWDMTRVLQYSPDGKLVATGDDFGGIKIWEPNKSDRALRERKLHGRMAWSLRFSQDGRRLASGSVDGTVVVSDVETLAPLKEYSFKGAVLACRFSPDDRLLYAADAPLGAQKPTVHVLEI